MTYESVFDRQPARDQRKKTICLSAFVEVSRIELLRFDLTSESTLGICAGKNAVQEYLTEQHNFKALKLERVASTPSVEKSASEAHVPAFDDASPALTFSTVSTLVEWVTKHWQENYVTTSIYDETIVEALSHRPFFILVHVDAPISVRWQRFKDRCAKALLTPPTLEDRKSVV